MSDEDAQNAIWRDAQQYAWATFEHHAKQRMDVFRFYLIVMGLVFAGAFGIIKGGHGGLAVLIFLFLLFITFIFWRLDVRGAYLVKNSEKFLKQHEDLMSIKLSCNSISIISGADKESEEIKEKGKFYEKKFYSFSQLFRAVYFSVSILCSLVILYIFYAEFI